MGQTISRVPERVDQIKSKIKNRRNRGPRIKRTEKTTACIDADFQLRQQCAWKGKPEILKSASLQQQQQQQQQRPDFVNDVSFAYIPQMRMDIMPYRVLKIPHAVASSDNICKLYHEMCQRIYAYDQANKLARPDDKEADICLWIKPYAEIRVERNMHGVEVRRCIKGTVGATRLKNRTLFIKWMLENSDWQEQLASNFWNLPKHGVGRDVTLPWFSLEVEYKPNGRKKLFEAHRNEFGAREITYDMFHPPKVIIEHQEYLVTDGEVVVEAEGIVIQDGDVMVEAGRIIIEDRETVVEAEEVVATDGETVVEFGGITIESARRQ